MYTMPFFVVGQYYKVTIDLTRVPSYTKKKSVHVGKLVHLPNVVNASSNGREVVYTALELEDLDHLPLDVYTGTPRIALFTLLEDGEEQYMVMGGRPPHGYVSSIEKMYTCEDSLIH